MKKIFSKVMLVAAAATAFFSCQKQETMIPETSQEVNGLVFASEKPAFDDETKTEWTGSTIHWSKGDKIRVAYTCDGVWQNAEGTATASEEDGYKTAKFYPSVELEEVSVTAKFNVPGKFAGDAEGEYEFYAVYPSSVVGSSDMKNAPSFNVILPSVQTPLADSFDPESDVMVAQSDVYEGMPEEAISLKWNRKVAHANITLKAINGISDDEQVLSVKITAQDGANMVGMQTYDMSADKFVMHANNTTANVLEINGANLSVEDGNIAFWASFLPCTWTSFAVEVNTNLATYTRTVGECSLDFKQNARNTLSVKMSGDDVVRTERAAEVTATLSFADKNKRTEYSTSKQVWVDNGITFTNNKAASTTNVADYANPVRLYASSSIIVEAPGKITKIVFDCNSSEYASNVKTSIGTTATTSVSSDKVTVTFSSPVETFTIAKLTAQVRMDAVTVTYNTAGGSETPDLTPVFTAAETVLQLDAVEATGTIDVIVKNLYDIEANAFADEDCTEDCNWIAAEWTSEGISYTVAENTSDVLRQGYIQINALDVDDNVYSEVIAISQATSFIAEVTIEEFLAKEVHPYMWYQLTGEMSNIVEGNAFGNFDITDDTGTVYVYGLTATKKPSNDQSFNSLGLRNGDELTLRGTRAVYKDEAQVGGPAYYVEHVEAPYIEVSPLTIKVSAEETEAIFTVDSNVDWNVMSEDVNDWDIADDGTVTVYFSENVTSEEVNHEVTVTSEVQDVVVTINQGKRGATAKYYVKVTTAPADWSGTYLITANASSANVSGLVTLSSMNAYNTNSYGKYVKITEAESGMVLSEESVDAYQVVIAKTSNGYSIKFGEYYLGKNSTSNDLKAYKTFTTTECEWTFNGLKIVSFNKNAYNLQWNNNKGQERFACYKGTQKDVVLYKLQD